MRIIVRLAAICLVAAAGCGRVAADTPVESDAEFLKRCREEVLQAQPAAATWMDRHCATRWRRAENSAPLAEAILALVPQSREAVPSPRELRARLPAVQWSSDGIAGVLGELSVYLPDAGNGIAFYWQKQGAEPPYNLIDALRTRGIKLRTLGCPQYPGASMGREKVMAAQLGGWSPFVFTVYSRPPPTGIDQGIYQVDVDFSGAIPEPAALRAGRYPGGGRRAFAVDPGGWKADCEDPE